MMMIHGEIFSQSPSLKKFRHTRYFLSSCMKPVRIPRSACPVCCNSLWFLALSSSTTKNYSQDKNNNSLTRTLLTAANYSCPLLAAIAVAAGSCDNLITQLSGPQFIFIAFFNCACCSVCQRVSCYSFRTVSNPFVAAVPETCSGRIPSVFHIRIVYCHPVSSVPV